MEYRTAKQVIFGYFRWLVSKLGPRAVDYQLLLKQLYLMEFFWNEKSNPMDGNRAADGVQLREDFYEEEFIDPSMTIEGPCNVLEMLTALSYRIEMSITGVPGQTKPEKWFWIMLENLDLLKCKDDSFDTGYVEQQVGKWLKRDITRNGKGGIFPLKRIKEDQRKVDIWMQMQSYLLENGGF